MSRSSKSKRSKLASDSSNKLILAFVLFLILILVSISFNLPVSVYDNAASESPASEFDILFLFGRLDGGSLLQPYAPGDSANNKTMLNSSSEAKFGHNILDRKYNPEIKPLVSIYIDSTRTAGIIVNFKIEFFLIEENRLALTPVAIATFDNYTTNGAVDAELIELTSPKYLGTPVDIKGGEGYGCGVRLTIWRTDELEDTDLLIYCGANGKISKIRIPYDRSLSSTKKDDDDNDKAPMDSGFLTICAIGVSCVLLYYRRSKFKA